MKRVFLFIFLGFLTANIFSITPHINKGQLEELSLSQALKELQITENELQQLDKDFFGVLIEKIDAIKDNIQTYSCYNNSTKKYKVVNPFDYTRERIWRG